MKELGLAVVSLKAEAVLWRERLSFGSRLQGIIRGPCHILADFRNCNLVMKES